MSNKFQYKIRQNFEGYLFIFGGFNKFIYNN